VPPLTVGFDLDLTLVDSRPGIRASMSALARESGVAIDVDVVLSRLGPKLEWELAQWYPADQIETMAARFRELYWDDCTGDGTRLLPGARESVDAVRARGGRIVIVTGKSAPLALRCLASVGIDPDAVVGHVYGDEKRDALIEHGVAVYVGDTVTDVRAAIGASSLAVAVATGPDDPRTLVAAEADLVLDSLTDFPAWLGTVA
jgi:phosphoglycolate phosphatase